MCIVMYLITVVFRLERGSTSLKRPIEAQVRSTQLKMQLFLTEEERRGCHIAVIQRLCGTESLLFSVKMFSTQALGDTGKMTDYHYSGAAEHRFSPYTFNGG